MARVKFRRSFAPVDEHWKIKPGKLDNTNTPPPPPPPPPPTPPSFPAPVPWCASPLSASAPRCLSGFSSRVCLRTRGTLVCAELHDWKPRRDAQITPGAFVNRVARCAGGFSLGLSLSLSRLSPSLFLARAVPALCRTRDSVSGLWRSYYRVGIPR